MKWNSWSFSDVNLLVKFIVFCKDFSSNRWNIWFFKLFVISHVFLGNEVQIVSSIRRYASVSTQTSVLIIGGYSNNGISSSIVEYKNDKWKKYEETPSEYRAIHWMRTKKGLHHMNPLWLPHGIWIFIRVSKHWNPQRFSVWTRLLWNEIIIQLNCSIDTLNQITCSCIMNVLTLPQLPGKCHPEDQVYWLTSDLNWSKFSLRGTML